MNSRGALSVFVAGCMVWSAAAYGQDAALSPAKVVQTNRVQLTSEQKAEAVGRMDLAKRIIANIEPEATRMGLDPAWKQATLNILLSNSSAKLAQIARLQGYGATIAAATTGKGLVMSKDIGSSTEDLTFHPWTPCRYVDTRFVGGKISGSRGFDLSLNGSTYGGVAGCAPTTLAGVNENQFGAMAMNITITDTSTAGAPGFAAARPVGSTALTSLVNWYTAGTAVTDANAAIVQMDQSGSLDEFEIVTSGAVHVIIDLFGAFTSPTATPLDCQDVVASAAIPAAGTLFLSSAACATGYTRTSGGQCQHTGNYNQVVLSKTGNNLSSGPTNSGANAAACAFYNLTGTAFTGYINVTCCRIPGH